MTLNNDNKFAFFTNNKIVDDLKSKTCPELQELLERQEHLLLNKSIISKLNDKGEKIRRRRDEIKQELESRITKTDVSIKKSNRNSNAIEWREGKLEADDDDKYDVEDDTDTLKILSENGQIPEYNTKTHITRLIEKEKDPNFSFKPFTPAVAEKIKNVIPVANTAKSCPSLVKTIHLDESLNLLSQQMSALKILGARSKRVEECIEDRMTESIQDHEQDEEVDEQETKAGLGISINVNVSS